ncbi:penicillin-binding transpeptidase domain-containing protein [Solibaculum mannosilyticum]|uniref:penicillin-binding transpeptidase domain-containing protein n=1 Tax=Solibaculum mannosilyticum TaxID=2780922 RepID=UPI0034AE38D4
MEENRHIGRRITLLVALLILVGVYVARLAEYQLIRGDEFEAQAAAPKQTTITAKAARGEIYDRNGRPLVVNKMGFSVVFLKQYMTEGTENQTILTLTNLLSSQGETWNDTLPIQLEGGQAVFEEDRDKDIENLKSDIAKINPYSTAQNCFDTLLKKYEIDEMEGLTVEQQRTIMGVRYEMDLRAFSTRYPFTFAEDISDDTVTRISENNIETPGVSIQRESTREYVSGDIAAHVIGNTGPIYAEELEELKEKGYAMDDVVGKSGIEKAMEDELRGQDGEKTITRDSEGNVVEDEITKEPVAGNSVILTIDSRIQLAAQNALETIITDLHENNAPGNGGDCTGGAAVVTDVNTGEVLALATYPYYSIDEYLTDYNSLLNAENTPLLNRATSGVYPPGSSMKPAVALGALQEGTIDANSVIKCTRKYTYYDDYQPTCLGYHGNETVDVALKNSCNYFFFDVGRRLGITKMNFYSRQLGLGEKTGLEISESTGILAGKEYSESIGQVWNPGDVLQAAIGQGNNAFTPVQLANYVATIANGGTHYQLHLIKSVKSYDMNETVVPEEANTLNELSVNEDNIDEVKLGMYKVANEQGGTGYRYFKDYPVTIACKTGTAETTDTKKNISNHSTVISFAPYDEPQYAVSVVLEHGGTANFDSNLRTMKMIYDAIFTEDDSVQQISPESTLLP